MESLAICVTSQAEMDDDGITAGAEIMKQILFSSPFEVSCTDIVQHIWDHNMTNYLGTDLETLYRPP